MNCFVKVSIWLICLMFVVDWAFELITMDSTIANIAGFATAIATVYVSVKTKCFTSITFKTRKHKRLHYNYILSNYMLQLIEYYFYFYFLRIHL